MSTPSPLFAAGLSAVMPGLGQLYNREDAKAAAILFSTFGIWGGLRRPEQEACRLIIEARRGVDVQDVAKAGKELPLEVA